MDMNWIDEIRDPGPRKRYIYNADDYDPQYGDPYYREHSTRADSLWRVGGGGGPPIPAVLVRGERHVDHVRCLRGRIPSNRLQDGDRRSA